MSRGMTDEQDNLTAPKREPVTPVRDDFDTPKNPFKLPPVFKWIGIGIASLFGLLIIAGLAVPFLVDFNALRDKAIEEVKAQTGFTISLSDKIGFSMMPLPKVTVYDVTVRHPSDTPDAPLVKAGEINVSVGMVSLFAGRVDIAEVNIKDGAANLRDSGNGNNWTPVKASAPQPSENPAVGAAQSVAVNAEVAAQGIEAPKDESAAASAPPAFSLDTIKLSNMKIAYTPATGATNDIAIDNGKVGLGGFDGPFSIDLDGKAFGGRLPIDLSADVGALKQGDAKPVPLRLAFKTDNGKVNLDGEALLGDAMQYKGKADIDFGDLTAIMKAIDPKAGALPVNKVALKSDNVTASPKAIDLQNAQITVDEAKGPVTLKLQGIGSDALTGDVIADLDTNGWKLAQGFKKVKVTGKFSQQGDVTRINPLDLTLDGQNVKGAVAMTKGGATVVDLNSDRIDLAPILEKFDVKDIPVKTLNGLAVKGQMQGNALNVTSLTIDDVSGMKLAASGAIRDLNKGEGVTLKATASSANLLKSLQQFPQVTIPKEAEEFLNGAGGATVDFAGSFAAGNLVANLNAMGGSAGIRTTVADIQKAPKLGAMTFVVNHPNTNALLGILAPGTKLGPAFNGAMKVEAAVAQKSETSWQVSDLKARLGGTDLSGNLNIGTGSVASVSGNLATGAIDIAQWFGAKETGAASTASASKGGTAAAAATGNKASGKWSTQPIDVTWMRQLGLDLTLKAASLKSDPWLINNPTLKISLSTGSLKLSDVSGGFMGGTIKLNANLDADANGVLSAKGDVKAAGINLDSFTRALAKTDKVVDGVGSLDLSINSKGASPNALVNALNGSGTLDGKSLIVYGLNIDDLVTAVNAVEDDEWSSALQMTGANFRNGSSKFNDASIPLTIQNGVLTWPATDITSTRSKITTQGRLDFPAWLINVSNNVQINTAEGRTIEALQIATTGSMDAPKTTTDSSALSNKLKERAGKLINKKLGDKLPTGVKDALGSFLGTTPKATETAPVVITPAPTTTAPATTAPAATSTTPVATTTPAAAPVAEPAPAAAPAATETAPAPAPVEAEPEPSVEEQVINGVLNSVLQ